MLNPNLPKRLSLWVWRKYTNGHVIKLPINHPIVNYGSSPPEDAVKRKDTRVSFGP